MARYKRDYFAKSNRGKSGEVFLNNLLAGPTKAERRQAEREQRVQNLLVGHGLTDLKARKILKRAEYNSISIDQIEKPILLPIVAERSNANGVQKAANQIQIAGRKFAAFVQKLVTFVIGFSLIAFVIYALSVMSK